MNLALTIIHVVISVLLIGVVLMQHGKQQGLSGAIAGGAETFFGKNKGRTIDAMLRKFTAVMAALFIISSLALTAVSVIEYNKTLEEAAQTEAAEGETATEGDAAQTEAIDVTQDENGNLVDAEGNIIMTAEQVAEQMAAQDAAAAGEAAEGEVAEGETAAPAEGEATEAPAAE